MKSYLTALDDGSFMRVQYGSKINGLLVEYYDKDYNLTGTKIIGKELPVFGGFYATKDNYYVERITQTKTIQKKYIELQNTINTGTR